MPSPVSGAAIWVVLVYPPSGPPIVVSPITTGLPGPLPSRGDVEDVQALHVVVNPIYRLSALCHHVQRPAGWIDHRSARDSDLRIDIVAPDSLLPLRHRRRPGSRAISRIEQIRMPQVRGVGALIVIGVKGVHAVVLRGHKNHVVRSFAGN